MNEPAHTEDQQIDHRPLLKASRKAQKQWFRHDARYRARLIKQALDALLDQAEDLAVSVVQETGKPMGEALSSDVLGLADLATYWTREGPAMLLPRTSKVDRLKMPGKSIKVYRRPHGVVLVISPWNYPLALPMRVIIPALLAGNSVVWKPSEITPEVARKVAAVFDRFLPGLLTVVHGDGATGAALIDAGPDMVHFTGSTRTGDLVAHACVRMGIPCELEMGGKDAAIVMPTADLRRAAHGIAWGILHNAGQDCASIERVLVHKSIADTFVPELAWQMERVSKQVPSSTTTRQLRTIMRQVGEALHMGAVPITGGLVVDDSLAPTLLAHVPGSASILREETFGPVAVVQVFEDEDDLVELVNDTDFGLGVSVWTGRTRETATLTRQLQVGMVWVNNHAFTGALPDVPWVGTRGSGHGVTNGPEAMQRLTRPMVVTVDTSKELEPWWYPYDRSLRSLMEAVLDNHRRPSPGTLWRMVSALGRRRTVQADR